MRKLLTAALLMLSCATAKNPYAYSGVMTKSECEAECGSRAYPVIGVNNGVCVCDTAHCMRTKMHGGCESLPTALNNQM